MHLFIIMNNLVLVRIQGYLRFMSPEEKNRDFIRWWFDSPLGNIFNLEEKYHNKMSTCSAELLQQVYRIKHTLIKEFSTLD